MQFINKYFVKSKYQNINLKILVSFIAAVYICAQSNKNTFSQLLLRPEYYVALLTSFIIAFTLIEMIHWQNYFLDKHWKWRENPISRTAILWVFGWLLPTKGAWVMAALYFQHYGYKMEETGYDKHLYGSVKLFIALVNFYYVWDLFKKEPQEIEEAVPEPIVTVEDEIPKPVGVPEQIVVAKDLPIALIYLENKSIFVLDADNKPIIDWKYNTIISSYEALSPENYLLIGRDAIVRTDVIQTIGRRKRSLELRVKPPISRTYVVSKGRVASIRKFGELNDVSWWDKKKRKFR